MHASAIAHAPLDEVQFAVSLFDKYPDKKPLEMLDIFMAHGWVPQQVKGVSEILIKPGCGVVIKCDEHAQREDKAIYSAFASRLLKAAHSGETYTNFPQVFRHRRGLTLLEELQPLQEHNRDAAYRMEAIFEHRTSQAYTPVENDYLHDNPVIAEHVALVLAIKKELGLDRISVKRADILQRADGTPVVVDIDPVTETPPVPELHS